MSEIIKKKWGELETGESVDLYRMENDRGDYVEISNLGVTIHSLVVHDKFGQLQDVVLGYDQVADYLREDGYLGATIGRYANRIGGASFELDGTRYDVDANEGPNTLHGGHEGLNRVLWDVKRVDAETLLFSTVSPAGSMGFPGTLELKVTLHWSQDSALTFHYEATTDEPTPVNLTNHSYFNLSGGEEDSVTEHELQLFATGWTPVDDALIPTGEVRPMEGSAFAPLLQPELKLGEFFESAKLTEQGLDHNFCLKEGVTDPELAARLYNPRSGIRLEVLTTQPGIQVYTAGQLTERKGKGGKVYHPFQAICLETQHYPDSPNQPAFPSTILRPGERFSETTIFRFS